MWTKFHAAIACRLNLVEYTFPRWKVGIRDVVNSPAAWCGCDCDAHFICPQIISAAEVAVKTIPNFHERQPLHSSDHQPLPLAQKASS